MTKLSVNINKLATLRNSRGGNNPDLLKAAKDIEAFGADGITVHPRPDERHIRYQDVYDLKKIIRTEFNIEGNPTEDKFVQLVLANSPHRLRSFRMQLANLRAIMAGIPLSTRTT
jgi:pyridoxine 5-phosphate synthase